MIRIGIVGCGRILAAHLRGYRLLRAAGVDCFRITALCARRTEDALMYLRRGRIPQRPAVSHIAGDPLAVGDEYLADFQPETEVQVYTDYRRMMAEAPIDAVNDFTSHALHHQVAAVALGQHKHLLTQKPLAITVAAGRQMCEMAERRRLVLGVFECFRQTPSTRHLHWAFHGGPAGRLQAVWIGYFGSWWAPDRIVADTPWRHQRIEGGGISLDLGVHFFHQVRHLAGEITEVSAQTAVLEPRRQTCHATGRVRAAIDCDADDTCFAHFRTTTGVLGQLTASWAGHGLQTEVGAGSVFYGTAGRASGDQLDLDRAPGQSLSARYVTEVPQSERALAFPLGLTDSFALNQLDWLQAIEGQRTPETNGREGLCDLAAAYALLESSLARRSVNVADVLSGRVREFQRPLDERYGLC